MSDAMQDAAMAFDKSMGNSNTADQGGGGASETKGQAEAIFSNFNTFAENSEGTGGGDGPDEQDDKPVKKVKRPAEEDDNELDEDADENDDTNDEDDEDENDEDGEDDDGDDDGLGELADKEFTVMVDGEEKTVKLKEALSGYIRTETFHKRLNEVNEGKQAVAAAARDTVARRNKAISTLEEAETTLKAIMPEEPNWDALYDAPNADVKQIRQLQKNFEGLKSNVDAIKTARAKVEQEAADEAARETAEFAEKEFGKFISKNPKITTKEDLTRELNSMKRTALALGFSEQEVLEVYDSRMLLVLQKASKYDRIMAKKPRAVQQTTKNGNNNAPRNSRNVKGKTVHKEFARAKQRLVETGSVSAAADVFQQILNR